MSHCGRMRRRRGSDKTCNTGNFFSAAAAAAAAAIVCLFALPKNATSERRRSSSFFVCSLKAQRWVLGEFLFCSLFCFFFTEEFLFSRSSLNSSLFCSFFPKYEFLSSFFWDWQHFGVLTVNSLNDWASHMKNFLTSCVERELHAKGPPL
jgi:hypothetical protein